MNNVISINRENRPDDLMSFREVMDKYQLKYGFLYKWAILQKRIPVYDRGGIVISEKDLLSFLDERRKEWRAS